MTIPQIDINTPELIWCISVALGIFLNSIFLYHSYRLLRFTHTIGPRSLIEAARMRITTDAGMLFCQVLFIYPGYFAATTPDPPRLTVQGWLFTLCFVTVELVLVGIAAISAAWTRRIVRFRLAERNGLL